MSYLTEVHLLNVPLENDYKNTLYFANRDAQTSYFLSRKVLQFTELSYQRKDYKINVPKHYDDLQICNYVMYRNPNHTTKWYYAFITEMKYINDEMTEVYIETDCMQTWFFDFVIKESFVEREHTADDTFGLNTIPESFELGEFVVNRQFDRIYNDVYVIVASNYDPYTKVEWSGLTLQGGMPQGVQWFAFHLSPNIIGDATHEKYAVEFNALQDFIMQTAKAGKSDFIQQMFVVPANALDLDKINENRKLTTTSITHPQYEEIQFPRLKNLAGYTPKNNKLLCYPFCYVLATNNAGTTATYKFEDFYYYFRSEEDASITDGEMHFVDCKFGVDFVPCIGCSIKMYPIQYKGTEYDSMNYSTMTAGDYRVTSGFQDEGFMCAKFPTLSWSSDAFTNWLTQNSINIAGNIMSGALNTAGGVATGGVAGGVGGALNGITNAVTPIWNAQFIPNTAQGNVNGGDVNFSAENIGFFFYLMSIKPEYAKTIDDYFTMFGYKTNRVKIPNKNHRQRFWFTKTIDINIDGAIPNKDMQVIKNCYNNGITFWKNANDINNYTASNSII